jgi:hypothetical protein
VTVSAKARLGYPSGRDGEVHLTGADALVDKEHFGGKTTEQKGIEKEK